MSEFTEDTLFREDFRDKIDLTVLEAAYTYNEWYDAKNKFGENRPEELTTRAQAIKAQLHLVEVAMAAVNDGVTDERTYEEYLRAFGTHKQVIEYEKIHELDKEIFPGQIILGTDQDQVRVLHVAEGAQNLVAEAHSRFDGLEYGEYLSWTVPVEEESDETYSIDLETPIGESAIIDHLSKREHTDRDMPLEEILAHSAAYRELGHEREAGELEESAAWQALLEIKENFHSESRLWKFEESIRLIEQLDDGIFTQLKGFFARELAYERTPNIQIMRAFNTLAKIEFEKEDESNDSDTLSNKQVFERAAPLIAAAFDQGDAILEREKVEKANSRQTTIQVKPR